MQESEPCPSHRCHSTYIARCSQKQPISHVLEFWCYLLGLPGFMDSKIWAPSLAGGICQRTPRSRTAKQQQMTDFIRLHQLQWLHLFLCSYRPWKEWHNLPVGSWAWPQAITIKTIPGIYGDSSKKPGFWHGLTQPKMVLYGFDISIVIYLPKWFWHGLTQNMVNGGIGNGRLQLLQLSSPNIEAVGHTGGHVPDPHRSVCHASPTTLWKTATCQQDPVTRSSKISKGSRWIEFRRVHRILCQNSADNQGCFLLTLDWAPRQRMPHDIAFHIHIFFHSSRKTLHLKLWWVTSHQAFFLGGQKIHNCQRFGTHGFGP